MIVSLRIENFALIEKLDISFTEGFSVITGETGAGKSILLGALGLLQGKRADFSVLKDLEKKCIIEAVFQVKNYSLDAFFEENDLEYEEHTIVRREILSSGKSRAFINDTPVNLQQLQDFSNQLIDIHSQHQNDELLEESFQLEILDLTAQNELLLHRYKQILKEYKKDLSLKNQLETNREQLIKDVDYNSFLLEEFNAIDLHEVDIEQWEEELEKLNNVEQIKETLFKIVSILNNEEIGVINTLKEVKTSLSKITSFGQNYLQLSERFNSISIELNDLIGELEKDNEQLFYDPTRINQLNDKLQIIYNLQRKHQVDTVLELIAVRQTLEDKVSLASDVDQQIETISNKIEVLTQELNDLSNQIHESRLAIIPNLIHQIESTLHLLGMPHARFNFELTTTTNFTSFGKDKVQLLFSANKGTSFGLLRKTASGGELSRIMLAIKSILVRNKKLPTLILDEIDSGISGEVATKMADIMKQMGQHMQLFSITHLPQIASKGESHYKVFKDTTDLGTVSKIKKLTHKERILEVAEMISGKNPSESALNHAKSLLY